MGNDPTYGGPAEGPTFVGGNWRAAHADEPIRVIVVCFTTPLGKITEKDMHQFAKAFSAWDFQAIGSGYFMRKETL